MEDGGWIWGGESLEDEGEDEGAVGLRMGEGGERLLDRTQLGRGERLAARHHRADLW